MNNIELINASAGSGKTYSLTKRVLDAISQGVAPEGIMATTFTNRAAGELQERIRVQLISAGRGEESGRIRDGFIGTVNSICGQLLKEYALEAGLSPGVEIMADEDRGNIFRISIDRVIEAAAPEMEPAARRLELTGKGGKFQQSQDWRDGVAHMVNFARSNQISPAQLGDFARTSWEGLASILGKPVDLDLDNDLREALKVAVAGFSTMAITSDTAQKRVDLVTGCATKMDAGDLLWSDWCRLAKINPPKKEQEWLEPVTLIAGQVLKHPGLHKDLEQIIKGTFACGVDALEEYNQYKREHGLMDFVDQEALVLDIAQHNQAFKDSMKDRINLLMVDEFQDTSPIQLALFLALNQLAGRSVWVGDPKQAIYGFRGTDPKLMEDVVNQIQQTQILSNSWRSKENLIAFSNALFRQAFYQLGAQKVCLTVPAERKEGALGGRIETWHLEGSKKEESFVALANGVQTLLATNPTIKPGEIGILCRTNNNCGEIAASLETLGIRASAGQGLLVETRECRFALAALRYMNNENDRLALVEIMDLAGTQWLADLMSHPDQTKETWNQDPLVLQLNQGRENMKYWTPLEALEEAISRVQLLRRIKGWPKPGLAVSNLDALRAACHAYMDLSTARRSAVTVDGFLKYVKDGEIEQAKGTDNQAVNVLTYHGAKGLEWPWVILTDLDSAPKSSVFGVQVEGAADFQIEDPLANRWIRYWPWPFGSQKQFAPLNEKMDDLPVSLTANQMALQEAQRLLYVGITRAKDGLVLAVRRGENSRGDISIKTQWMDLLTDKEGNPIIEWPLEEGAQTLQVGDTSISVTNQIFAGDSLMPPKDKKDALQYLPDLPEGSKDFPPARVSPSGLSGQPCDLDGASWEIIEQFPTRLSVVGNPEMNLLGNAVHGYLGADRPALSPETKQQLAKANIKNWEMEGVLDEAELVAVGNQLWNYLGRTYPDALVRKEWPMTLRTKEGQHMQGWMDLLLELPNGYILVDHKNHKEESEKEDGQTFSGKEEAAHQSLEEIMKQYLPQMGAYQKAIETATGKPVLDILLHLPISGIMLKMKKRMIPA